MTPLLPINWAVLLLMSRKFFIEKLKVRKTFWLLKDEEYWNRVSSLLLLKEEFKCFVITRLPREARPEPEASPACFPGKPQITSNVFILSFVWIWLRLSEPKLWGCCWRPLSAQTEACIPSTLWRRSLYPMRCSEMPYYANWDLRVKTDMIEANDYFDQFKGNLKAIWSQPVNFDESTTQVENNDFHVYDLN